MDTATIISSAARSPRKTTLVAPMAQKLGEDYYEVLAGFRQLDRRNFGKLRIGRRGAKTRFEWNTQPKNLLIGSIGDQEIGNDMPDLYARTLKLAAQTAQLLQDATELVGLVKA